MSGQGETRRKDAHSGAWIGAAPDVVREPAAGAVSNEMANAVRDAAAEVAPNGMAADVVCAAAAEVAPDGRAADAVRAAAAEVAPNGMAADAVRAAAAEVAPDGMAADAVRAAAVAGPPNGMAADVVRAAAAEVAPDGMAADVAHGVPAPPGAAPGRVDPLHAGERAIARLLRGGVALAAGLLLLALLGAWIGGGAIRGTTVPLTELLAGRLGLPAALAQLGLLSLAVTPLARVALATGVFARAGEKRQALVSAAVLALLLVALLLGAAEG